MEQTGTRLRLTVLAALALALACGDDGGMMGGEDGGERCESDADCNDENFCNGVESCTGGTCMGGANPCPGLTCDEDADECTMTCEGPEDADGDGFPSIGCGGTDCDDDDGNVNPGATEICDTANVDEDCNPDTFGFRDADGDGVGDAACCNGENCGTDCDDGNANIGFGLSEACDSLDNDCDGNTDEGALTTYYLDSDGDDFGDPEGTVMMGCSQPEGYSENAQDCDDTTASVNPSASEICDAYGNNDCNDTTPSPFDPDGDGYDTYDATSCPTGLDCVGDDASVNPGSAEVCDGFDTNCDGAEVTDACYCDGTCMGTCFGICSNVDYDTGACAGTCTGNACVGTCDGTCTTLVDIAVQDEDDDEDGELSPDATCTGGPLGDLPRTDCNDGDPMMGQGIPEICDNKDNDCDGAIDEESYFDVVPIPFDGDTRFEEVVARDGGAVDFSCLGSRSITIGASTTTSVVVPFPAGGYEGLTAIQIWTDASVPAVSCGAGCTADTSVTDLTTNTVSVAHDTNAAVALVMDFSPGLERPADYVLHAIRPPEDVVPLLGSFGELGPGAAMLIANLVDCAGSVIDNHFLRIYRSSARTSCAQNPDPLTGPGENLIAIIEDTPFSDTGELVTVEAVGRLDGTVQVLAREQVRMRSRTISTFRMPPLRADSPPVP